LQAAVEILKDAAVVYYEAVTVTVQVTVWGDYGRSDRKVFMGVVQIRLDSLDLASMAIGWYKLFSNLSLVSAAAAGGSSASSAATASGGAGLLQRASSASSRS